tara:strand:- start:4406 stop:5254 length:849 start_codon:yes stop_codon:yes gene_type:complete
MGFYIILILIFIITFIILFEYKCKETFLLQSDVQNKIKYDGNIDDFIVILKNAFCSNATNGILISILNTDSQSKTLYIDGSGSIFSNFSDGSRKFYGSNERIGLIWHPDNINHFTSPDNCMYPSDGATVGRMVNNKIDRCAKIEGQTPIPKMCNNTNSCIQDALSQQKQNCSNNINCNYNEFVIDRYLDTTYDKTKETVKYSSYPSALVYIIPNEYFVYNYEDDFTKMSNSFTDDTTIIIIILNGKNYPTFEYTTVGDFKNYFSNSKKTEINKILSKVSTIC